MPSEPLTAADLDEAKRIAFEDPWWAGSNAARLAGKLIAEVERLTASDPYTAGLNDGIGQAHRRIAELEAQLADYESDRRRVYAEPCDLPPDEKHCSCVAPQREEIKRLNAQLKAVRSASDECIDVVVGQKELLKQRIAELEAQLAAARENGRANSDSHELDVRHYVQRIAALEAENARLKAMWQPVIDPQQTASTSDTGQQAQRDIEKLRVITKGQAAEMPCPLPSDVHGGLTCAEADEAWGDASDGAGRLLDSNNELAAENARLKAALYGPALDAALDGPAKGAADERAAIVKMAMRIFKRESDKESQWAYTVRTAALGDLVREIEARGWHRFEGRLRAREKAARLAGMETCEAHCRKEYDEEGAFLANQIRDMIEKERAT